MLPSQKSKVYGVCWVVGQWVAKKPISKVESHLFDVLAKLLAKLQSELTWEAGSRPAGLETLKIDGKTKFSNVYYQLLATFSKMLKEAQELV